MPFSAAPPKPPRPPAPSFGSRPFQPGGGKPPGQKPNFRQMGGKTIPFMADGGIGAPEPIGGGGPPQAAPPAPDMDNDHDQDSSPVVRPESVNFHDQLQRCDGCANYGQDGNCSLLRMQVSGEGGCSGWDDAGGGAGQEPDGDEPPPDDMGGGMEGGQQQ